MEKMLKNFLAIITYIIYIITIICNICKFIQDGNTNSIVIIIWVFCALINFTLYIQEEKWHNRQIVWRDNIIKSLIEDRVKKIKEEEGNDNNEN